LVNSNIIGKVVGGTPDIKNKRGRPRAATQEQIEIINRGLHELGLGNTLEEFASNFSDENKRMVFARNLQSQIMTSQQAALLAGHNGTLQPILSQQMFQNINVNPIVADADRLERALMNPAQSAEYLQSISQYLAYTVGNYQRAVYYFSQIKSFDYELLPLASLKGLSKDEKRSYYSARNRCLDLLHKLNIKYQFPKIDLEVMFSGVATYYIKETEDSIQFLQLPNDYVYLVSPWAYGYKASLDLTMFDSYMGISSIAIPELASAYAKFVELRKNGLEGRKYTQDELTTIQYYPLDPNNFWTFTFDPIHPDRVPPLASSFAPSLDTLTYRKLLKNKVALDLYKVIALKIPLNKDSSKMALNYIEASKITDVIQSILPENIRVYSSPFDSDAISTSQEDKFEAVVNMANDTFNTSAGLQAGLFGGSELKQSMALLVSADVDYDYVKHMYFQYANCINFILNRNNKTYRFNVNMFGNSLRRIDDVKMYGELMASKNAPATRFFAAMGYPAETVVPLLEMEDDMGIKDLMKPLTSAFQASKGSASTPGRKPLSRDELSPNTETGRDLYQ